MDGGSAFLQEDRVVVLGLVTTKKPRIESVEPYPYDPAKARQLLAEAGYPNGFDAGELHPFLPYFSIGEAVAQYLGAVGIRVKMRSMERAA